MTPKRVRLYRNLAIAIFIPLIVAALQWLIWPNLRPYTWVLFYPAVVLSSWIGGPWAGVIATLLSAVIGVFVFNPLELSLELSNPNVVLSTMVFVIMGLLVSYVYGRWQQANRRADVLEQLHASEARFAAVFHSSPNAIALSRLSDNQLLDVNSAWESLTGWSRADAIGKTAVELNLWRDPAQRDRLKTQIAEDHTVHGQEIQMHTRSGAIQSLLISAEIITLQGVPCMLSVALDITERKQAEEQLNLKSTALNAAANAIVITDRDGIIQWANPAFTSLTGYSAAEAVGQNPRLLKSNRHDPAYYKNLWDTVLRGEVWTGQLINRRKDGSLYTDEMTITPLRNAEGQISHFIAIKQDVSERKQAEEALFIKEQEYRTLVENIPDFVVRYDTDLRRTLVNPAWEKVSGLPASEVINVPITEVRGVPNPAPAEYVEKLQRALTTGTTQEIEFIWANAHGVPLILEYKIVPERDPSGKVTSLLAAGRDITAGKQAEEALRISEVRYRTAQAIGHVGNWEYNLRTTQFWGSDEAKRIYGFDLQQANFSADEVENCILERERVHQALVDLIEAGKPYNLEFEIHPKDSSGPKIISSIAELKEDEHGEPLVVGVIQDITERKQAEKKLRESEEKYRDLINGMNDTVMVLDFDTTILDVNNAAARVLGYTREELLSMTILDIDAALTPDQIQGLASSMPRDKIQVFETWHWTKSGQRLPVEVSSSLVSYGARTVIMSIARDITERKRAEEERQVHLHFVECMDQINRAIQGASNLEQMMSDVLDVVLTIFDCDRAGLVYPCDPDAPSWSAPMERARPEWPGVLALGLMVPMDPQVARVFRVSRAADGPVEFGPGYSEQLPVEIATRFNIQSQMTMALYPKIGHPWNLVMHQCSYPRVWTSQEKRLLKEIGWRIADALTSLSMFRNLHESEERFRTVADFTYDWEYWIGPDGQLIYVSPSCERITGYGAAEFQADAYLLEKIVHPDDHATLHQHLAQEFAHEQVGIIDFRIVTKRGEICWINHICQSVTGSHGRWLGRRASNRDITDRKQAEAAVLQLNAELEERVAQRTHDLAVANERLTELDRLKSKFVSDVSHELRTPVTSLSLYIELLEYGKPEKREQYVARLKEQMARLRQLIEEILDLSRLEREREESDRSPVDINAIAEHVSAIQLAAAETAGLTLTCEVANNLPLVAARPDQLTRAVTNLVSNAIKYTPQGTIHIKTCMRDNRVCVEVRDTGMGVPADELPHLFERFYRGKAVAQSTIPGTGLGLSIVKEIIEAHDGTVEVESELGTGSTFRVWLPISA